MGQPIPPGRRRSVSFAAHGRVRFRGWATCDTMHAAMGLAAGDKVGAYEILAPLGAGGMGEVFRARDTRLGREVALKVLPAAVAGDAERLRRFEAEARAAGALAHPNVLVVHDVGSEGDTHYLVTELLEGATLRDRLRDGRVPPRKALDWAAQISQGLAAAHEKGIVHRDLKPENLFVTKDGRVKILDFGLAKALGGEISETESTLAATAPGAVLGTAGYMAPEQVRGRAADARSDIFAFGAVLYEMLAGKRAFDGDSHVERGHAILTKDPPELSSSGVAVPPAVERLIRRCLETAPEERFQSARDLGFALEAVASPSGTSGEGVAPATAARGYGRTAIVSAVAVVIALGAFAAGRWARPRPPHTLAPAPTAPGPQVVKVRRLTQGFGSAEWPAISPDGTWFVYARKVGTALHVFRQRVRGEQPQDLSPDSKVDNTHPAISPDGEKIAFRSDRDGGGVFIMGATGESVRRLTDFGYHPAWAPDGAQVAVSTFRVEGPAIGGASPRIELVQVSTGARRVLRAGPSGSMPTWSPDGRWMAYFAVWTGGQRGIAVVPTAGGEERRLTLGSSLVWAPAWSPDGRYLYFASNASGVLNLARVTIDSRTGQAGAPEPVTTGVGPSLERPSFSRDGRLLLARAGERRYNIARVRLDAAAGRLAGRPEMLTRGANAFGGPDVSPDGRWVTCHSAYLPGTQEDIWVMRADGTGLRRLTDDPARDRGPRFTHDGKRIVFGSNRSGRYEVWSIAPDGANLTPLGGLRSDTLSPIPSPIDSRIAVHTVDPGVEEAAIFNGDRPFDQQTPLRLEAPGAEMIFTVHSWSADARELVGERTAGGASSLQPAGIVAYDVASGRYRDVWPGGNVLLLRDRRLITTTGDGRLLLADPASGRSTELLALEGGQVPRGLALSRDERWIYFGVRQDDADVWLLELK